MKKIIALGSVLVLLGCGSTSTSETLATSAKNTVNQLYKDLPSECKTEEVKTLKTTAVAQIEAITTACDLEKESLRHRLNTYRAGLLVLVAAVLVFLWRKSSLGLFRL